MLDDIEEYCDSMTSRNLHEADRKAEHKAEWGVVAWDHHTQPLCHNTSGLLDGVLDVRNGQYSAVENVELLNDGLPDW